MTGFERVLAPVDLGERSRAALERGIAVSRPDAEIALIHVIERIEGEVGELDAFYRRLEDRAREELDRLAGEIAKSGRSVRSEVVVGRRVEEIVDAADRLGSDLIVMASHRLEQEGAGRDWFTISYRVAVLAPCSVLLVK
jgi:nucleotide-binding universal stress UspA family protein